MQRLKRLIIAFVITVFCIILLYAAACAYLIMTPLGAKLLVGYFKQEFVSVGLMHVGHCEGSLQHGFILKDVSIKGLAYMPDAYVRIQEIHAHLPLRDLLHYHFDIFNARIIIPDSDPVVFTGEVYAGQIKGNLYGRSVDIHEASRFWTPEDIRKNLQGYITDVDFTIQGPMSSPQVSGPFSADSIRYKSVLFSDGISNLNLIFLPSKEQIQMKGVVIINSGLVQLHNTNLELSRSKITYWGDTANPRLDIHLGAKVEDMNIHLAIKGDLDHPQLVVSSDPPMAPQDALRVLFTDNALFSSTSPFNYVSSSELAQDFLNYSLYDMNDPQQVGLKTKLTDNLKLGVEMDQVPASPVETNIYYSRKINGEMDLSDHMSLNISKQILPQNNYSYPGVQDTESENETQVYLQYKKRF